jgi:hypothetical protein
MRPIKKQWRLVHHWCGVNARIEAAATARIVASALPLGFERPAPAGATVIERLSQRLDAAAGWLIHPQHCALSATLGRNRSLTAVLVKHGVNERLLCGRYSSTSNDRLCPVVAGQVGTAGVDPLPPIATGRFRASKWR